MPKKKTNKKASKPAKKSNREQDYLDSLDLRDYWESFSTAINENGSYKFPTVWSFIKKITSIAWQRDFLYWLLGPKLDTPSEGKYPSFPQYDWITRRDHGHWYSPKSIDSLTSEIKSHSAAFAKVAALGDINIKMIERLVKLQDEFDRYFAVGIMLSNLDAKENALRANLYMSLQKQIVDLQEQVQTMFARSQGVDIKQLTQFLGLFGTGIGQAAAMGASMGILKGDNTIEGNSSRKDVASQFADLIMKKSIEFDIAPPAKEVESIMLDAKPRLVK